MKKGTRQGAKLSFAAMAMVLAVGSIGYACTIFKGTMSVTGNGKDPATGKKNTITLVGSNRSMSWCGDQTNFGFVPAGTGYTFVSSAAEDPSLNIKIGPTVGSVHNSVRGTTCDTQLPDSGTWGTYHVTFYNGDGYVDVADNGVGRFWNTDCMFDENNGGPPGARHVGTLDIVAGSGEGEYDLGSGLAANAPNEESGLCVTDQGRHPDFGPPIGNFAPVTVL